MIIGKKWQSQQAIYFFNADQGLNFLLIGSG
jgi:hypothetical protein